MPQTDISRFLTKKEVAARLHCHGHTLRWWARHKNFGPPFIKIGQRYFYDPDELERWIEAQPSNRPPDAVA